MPDLSKYLRRFRRLVSPPGRPGPIAVPADRSARAADELEAVFQAVDAIQEEAERIRDESAEQARGKDAEAEDEAKRILSQARDRAEQVRAQEASRHREDIEKEAQSALDEARREARRIRERTQDKLDSMAQRLVARLTGADEQRAG